MMILITIMIATIFNDIMSELCRNASGNDRCQSTIKQNNK